MRLLTLNSSKLDKAAKFGYHNAALYLSPADLSGHNVCSHATAGCIVSCLNAAGHGGIKFKRPTAETIQGWNPVQAARYERTKTLFHQRNTFFSDLLKDLKLFVSQARKRNLFPALRLNGTSDLDWDALALDAGISLTKLCEEHKMIRYEYTKVPRRFKHPGVHWTFSLSEHPKSEQWALEYLQAGHNVAVVFRKDVPASFKIGSKEWPVLDGEEHDLRFLDPKAHIVGLKAKGPAKRDTSGFVR